MTREFIDGDRVGFDIEGEVEQHDAVKLVGPRTVAATDASDEEVWGIAMNSGSDDPEDKNRNRVTIVQHGMYTCNVSESADINDYLTASTTSGQLRSIDGEEDIQAKLFRVLDDVDEDGKMLVYIS